MKEDCCNTFEYHLNITHLIQIVASLYVPSTHIDCLSVWYFNFWSDNDNSDHLRVRLPWSWNGKVIIISSTSWPHYEPWDNSVRGTWSQTECGGWKCMRLAQRGGVCAAKKFDYNPVALLLIKVIFIQCSQDDLQTQITLCCVQVLDGRLGTEVVLWLKFIPALLNFSFIPLTRCLMQEQP